MRCVSQDKYYYRYPTGEVRARWAAGGGPRALAEEPALDSAEAAEVPGEARDTEGLAGSAEEGPVPPPAELPRAPPRPSTGEQSPPPSHSSKGSTGEFPSNWDRGVSRRQSRKEGNSPGCWCAGRRNPADCGHHRRRSASSLCRLHRMHRRRDPWPLQALGLSQQLPGALHRGVPCRRALGSVEGWLVTPRRVLPVCGPTAQRLSHVSSGNPGHCPSLIPWDLLSERGIRSPTISLEVTGSPLLFQFSPTEMKFLSYRSHRFSQSTHQWVFYTHSIVQPS